MRRYLLVATVFAATPAAAQVSVTPAYQQIVPNQTLQFAAAGGPVTWQVNNVVGGTAATGTITTAGVYTAPAALPNPAAVTVTAVAMANPRQSATATLTLLAAQPTGTIYYVSPTGSDTNAGSLTAPFKTLQHAATIAVAGDTVLARQGTYNALLTPPHSGDPTHGPITFASYPGELATIDGTKLAIPGGMAGLITLNSVSYVIIEGFQLQNYTTPSLAAVPIGIFITGASSGDQIINNRITKITTTAKTTPTQCGSNAFGLTVYGTKAPASINGLVISGNEIDHLLTGCSETLSLDGNVDGFAVISNMVHDDNNIAIGVIGFEKVSPNPAYDQARNGEIRGNLVFNITSYGNPDYGKQYAADGIYVDGGTLTTIEQNTVTKADLGIEVASEHKGRVSSYITVRNNVVYGNNSNGISIGGYGLNRGGSQNNTIVNNTLYGNDTKQTGSGEFQIQFNASGNLFQNNIVFAGPQNLFVNNFTKTGANAATLNNNVYFSAGGAGVAQFKWVGKLYPSYAKWLAAVGQDKMSAFANPLFQNAATLNFDLQAGSPAFGAASDLGSAILGNVDYPGNPRVTGSSVTVGAYQQ